MYIYVYISLFVPLSLSLSLSIYIYIYTYTHDTSTTLSITTWFIIRILARRRSASVSTDMGRIRSANKIAMHATQTHLDTNTIVALTSKTMLALSIETT